MAGSGRHRRKAADATVNMPNEVFGAWSAISTHHVRAKVPRLEQKVKTCSLKSATLPQRPTTDISGRRDVKHASQFRRSVSQWPRMCRGLLHAEILLHCGGWAEQLP